MATFPLHDRRCERLPDAPSAIVNSLRDRGSFQAGQSGPFDYVQVSTGESQPAIFARIVGLFLGGSPVAILFRVSLGIVNAFKRVAIRTFAHVGEESIKRAPLLAESDSPSTPVLISGCRGPETSGLHSGPTVIGPGTAHPVPDRGAFIFSTSATDRPSHHEIGRVHDGPRPAVAFADPSDCWFIPRCYLQGDQTPKSSAGKIKKSAHRNPPRSWHRIAPGFGYVNTNGVCV